MGRMNRLAGLTIRLITLIALVEPFARTQAFAQKLPGEGGVKNELPTEEVPAEPRPAPSPLDRLPSEIIYLPSQARNGELVPVPRGASLEGYLKSLREGREKPADLPPPAVAELELTGTADDVRAVLQARFVIKNLSGEQFVRLPLALHEAVIREEVRAEGPGILQYEAFDRTLGYVWWLRGTGRHELTLEISVPVKRQGTGRRLQLTLPDATISRLKLTTGFPSVRVTESSGEVEVLQGNDHPARLEKLGLGTRLDITWQPVVTESPVPPVLEAETAILAHAAQEKLLVEAYQRINVVQGTVSEVTVRLPSQAELINVEGVRDYRSHRIAPEDPGKVFVQLNGPTSGQIQLKWTVRLPAAELRRFVLDGFQVDQARRQSGQIGLIPMEGLRMTVTSADQPNLWRINTAELRALSAQVSRAYRFFNQPFRMVVGVETIEPYFTIQPRLALGVSVNELTLEGDFALHVLRGDVTAIDLEWPNWKSDGWILEERPDALIENLPPSADTAEDRLRLRLIEDHADQLTLRFQARRAIRPGDNIPITLPRLLAPDSAPVLLKISDAPNVSSELTPLGETVLSAATTEAFEASSDAVSVPARRERMYRLLTREQAFTVRVSRLEQRVHLSSLTLLSLEGTRLRGVQHLLFDVQHEPLSHIRLAIPPEGQSRLAGFQLDPDRSLSVEWTSTDGQSYALLTLPEPRLGRFSVQATLEIPLTDEQLTGQVGVELPLIRSPDFPMRLAELEMAEDNEANLTVTEATWTPRPGPSGGDRWTSDGSDETVTVQFHAEGEGTRPLLITEAHVETTWDRQGTAHCQARYRMTGWFARIQLVLPGDASPPRVTWDGRELASPDEILAESKPRHYSLRVRSSEGAASEHELTVTYRLPSTQSFGLFNRWSLLAPRLPQGRWMAEGTWVVRFPSDQHLFGYASSVTPQFSWQWTGLFWSRVSRLEGLSPRAPSPSGLRETGNAYAFSQFGEVREFRCSTMSAPTILFLGASTALLVGFVLLKFSWLQHVMAFLGGAFTIALVGLWFRPQLEVLLQPILVGCVFPLVAVWIQNSRRRRIPPVLSFDPLMDLAEPRSSANSPPHYGGHEPVLVRTPSGSTHDFLHAEARSGLP